MVSRFVVILYALLVTACNNDTCDLDVTVVPLNVCEDGKPQMWESFPLFVMFDSPATEEAKVAVKQEALMWNEQTGLNLFTFEECPTCPLLRIYQSNEEESAHYRKNWTKEGTLAFAHHIGFNDHCAYKRAAVFLLTRIKKDQMNRIVRHELGHILGMHHDAHAKKSLLMPSVHDSPWCLPAPSHLEWVMAQHERVEGNNAK